jgi:hypothetical protein
MKIITEGKLVFSFESDQAVKYDDWSFYRNQLTNAFGKAKAVDLIFIDEDDAWLIEVKDYRHNKRTKPSDLAVEIAEKIRDTLAGLAVAQKNSSEAEERAFARDCMKKKFRVVLHLEQPATGSRLFPRIAEPDDLSKKLKQLLKAVDAHPVVVDQKTIKNRLGWSVSNAL